MTSTLAWLQFGEAQARRSRELIRALDEPATLDSIGIGAIRDGIERYADLPVAQVSDARGPPHSVAG